MIWGPAGKCVSWGKCLHHEAVLVRYEEVHLDSGKEWERFSAQHYSRHMTWVLVVEWGVGNVFSTTLEQAEHMASVGRLRSGKGFTHTSRAGRSQGCWWLSEEVFNPVLGQVESMQEEGWCEYETWRRDGENTDQVYIFLWKLRKDQEQ